jgi:hypothetical protein
VDVLARSYDAAALCGLIAHAAGLRDTPAPCRPADLVVGFDWARVRGEDRIMAWRRGALVLDSPDVSPDGTA